MTTRLNLYFDNAATSWPKPEAVYRAPEIQMREFSGNPGRSGHTRTLEADRLIYRTREAMGQLFNIDDPSRVVFACNATDALNIGLKGFLNQGDHVLYTAMEHNSVLRPLGRLHRDNMIETTMISCSTEGLPDLNQLEKLYQPNTKLLVINHASNVTGTIAPLAKMIKSAHKKGVQVLIDAAQTAGVIPIDVQNEGIDMLAFTGHKGLLGPTGTGGLFVRKGIDLKPFREGGTGSQSESDIHPETMPERLEAGTLNSAGLAGLLEGVNFILETGINNIRQKEEAIIVDLWNRLLDLKTVTLYGPQSSSAQTAAVVSFTIKGTDCGEIGYILENTYGILCRTGLHCAPFAHQAIGTFPEGTIRLSPGFFTTNKDIDFLIKALKEIIDLVSR